MRTFTSTYRGRPEFGADFWPQPEVFTGAPKIATAVGEVRELCERATKAKQDAHEAVFEVERAEAEDRQQAADAVRAGRARPKPRRPVAQRKAEEAEREAAILETAASDAAKLALEALDQHGGALAAKLEGRRTKLCEALLDALSKVGRLEEELAEISGLSAYLEASEVGPWRGQKYNIGRVPMPRTSDAPSFPALVAALKEAVNERLPQPEQPAPNVQPLRAHPMRGAA
jgi:hypothetical protein